MGQQGCCESNANKKALLKSSYRHSENNEKQVYISQMKNQNNIEDSIYSNLSQKQSGIPYNNQYSSNFSEVNKGFINQQSAESIYSYNLKKENCNFRCINSIDNSHNDNIVSLIELMSGNIASGSYDQTIKIWNLNEKKCIKIIKENAEVLCLLEFEHNKLLVGTKKEEINLWDLENSNDEIIYSFEGHTMWVNCLVKINDDNFASCSNDTNIIIWNWKNKSLEYILEGHLNAVSTMILLFNGNLCSGSLDLTIKIWDLKNRNCIETLNGNKHWVLSLCQLSNGDILSSDGKKIKIWSTNYKYKNEIKGHSNKIRALCQISKDLFVSASYDKTIKIWDINSMDMVQNLEGHLSKVNCVIKHIFGYLVSCSDDKTIKVWETSN